MIRQAPRYLLRSTSSSLRSSPARRFISTAPPAQKSRSWKSSAARWGLAIGAIYYYNTSAVFAEEPAFPSIDPKEHENALPTLESIAPSRKPKEASSVPDPGPISTTADAGLEETEEEASQEGAFNEETGEINWDCPCLGGMAHGPCGEQFRAAFSCFVFSKEEPKGMDCIEHFKTMQTCFREHPDIYGAELDEEEEDAEGAVEGQPAPEIDPLPTAATSATPSVSSSPATPESHIDIKPPPPSSTSSLAPASSTSTGGEDATQRAKSAKAQVQRDHGAEQSESDSMSPKAAHDAASVSTEK